MTFLVVVFIFSAVFMQSPFSLSVLLLFVSIVSCFLLSLKFMSLWLTAVILLTFSGGMMVLFSYTSSLVSLGSGMTRKGLFLGSFLLPIFFLLGYFSESNFMSENYMKEFSTLSVTIFFVILLSFFMAPMMENCFNPNSPVQSCF